MENYLLAENDGLPAREFSEWSKEKVFFFNKYINTVGTAMRNRSWRRRNYIELFSGSGKCKIKNKNEYFLGSPLIALTIEHPFTNYYFVEQDINFIQTLEKRCSDIKNSQICIQFINNDANKAVRRITDEIDKIDKKFILGKWSSYNLAFLDPNGLELEWKTVEELAKIRRMDLIIHYSQFGITRNATKDIDSIHETSIDKFFGDREWREIYKKHRNDSTGIHRHLIDHYQSKLQSLGYVVELKEFGVTNTEPLMKNSLNAPLYRLIFASKHTLGLKIWRDITKIGADGQIPLWK